MGARAVKYDEVFRILTLTTPPSRILEPKALRQYYLGFLKNLFEKYRYKVEYNCPVYLADARAQRDGSHDLR